MADVQTSEVAAALVAPRRPKMVVGNKVSNLKVIFLKIVRTTTAVARNRPVLEQ